MQTTSLKRVFQIGNLKLVDIQPELPPEEAVKVYATAYPIVEFCTVSQSSIDGDTVVFKVEPPPAKTKG